MAHPATIMAMPAGSGAPALEPHAMVAQHARPLAQRYTLLVALLTGPLLLLVAGLGLQQFRAQRGAQLESLAQVAREQRLALDGAVRPLRDHVQVLRRMAEDRLAGTEPQAPSPWRELLRPTVTRTLAGPEAVVSLDHIAGHPLAARLGNVVADPSLLARSPEAMTEVDVALGLFEPMRLQHLVTPYLRWSFYFSAQGDLVAIFPFAPVAALAATGSAGARDVIAAWMAHDVFADGMPGRNPQGRAYWTPLYQDAGGRGWMVGHAAPVRDRDRFVGVVGVDLDLGFLGDVLRQLSSLAGDAWVVNDRGEVLAGTGFDPADATRVPPLAEVLAPALQALPVPELLRPAGGFRHLAGSWVAAERLEEAPFTLLRVVSAGELNGLILPRFLPYLLAVGTLLLLLLAAQFVLQRGFVRPALALVRQIRDEVEGEPGPLPRVPPLWRPWLNAVHEAFAAKRAYEARLAESEARFKAAAESIPDGLAIFDAEDRFAYYNSRYPEHLTPDLRARLALGVRFEDWLREVQAKEPIYHAAMGEGFLQRRLALHRKARTEHEQKLSDGRWVRLREARMPDGGRVLLTTDVTAGKAAEARLQESEARFLAAAEALPDGLVIFDPEDRIVFHNSRHPEHLPPSLRDTLRLGVRFEDWIREALARGPVYHPDMGADYAERRLAARGEAQSEREHRHADGRWMRVREARMPDGGRLLLTTDITVSRVQADALEDQRRKLEAVLANIAEGVSIVDAEGRVVLVNEGLVRLYGYPAELAKPGAALATYVEHRIRSGFVTPEEALLPFADLVAQRVERFLAGGASRYEETTAAGRTILVRRERLPDGLTVSTHSDVTELKHQERERALLAAAVEQAGDSVEVTGADHRFTYVNPAFTRLTGWSREEALGKTPAELLRSDRHDEAFFAAIDATLLAGATWQGRLISRHKDGHLLFQETTISPLRDADGNLTHSVAAKRDIGEQIRAEEALRASEARLAAFMEHAPVGMYLKDLNGRYLMLNPEMGRVFGRPTAEMVGRSPEEVFAPDEVEVIRRFDREIVETAQPTRHEEFLENRDAYAWSMVIRFPIRDARGRIGQIGGFDLDITSQKRVLAELAASEARFRTIVEDQTEFISRFTPDFTITFVNQAYAQQLGRAREAIVGTPLLALMTEPQRARFIAQLEALTPEAPTVSYEMEVVGSDGERCWEQWTDRALFDGQGRVVEYQSVGRDVTEGRRAEEELRRSEQRLRAIAESHPTPMTVTWLDDHRLAFANRAFFAAFRVGPGQLDAFDREGLYADPGERDALLALVAETGEVESREVEMRTADGKPFPAILTARAIEYEGRRCSVTSFLDLSALKAAEAEIVRQREALYQSEKLTALGSLLAGVAHELNNPLSVVTGYAEMLRETCTDPATLGRVARIHAAAERCARIVKTFLAMARQKPPRRGPTALPEVIEGALELVGYGLRTAGVKVTFTAEPELPLVWGDADQLHQVFVNLVVNAQQALIEVPAPRRLELRARLRDGMVEVQVEDNGPGMSPEVKKRIFEPFFTTKPQGAGIGIGLSVCHGIVTAHGGRMAAEVGAGRGTLFRITLPTADPPEGGPAAPVPATPAARGRVLVVDDEAEIADLVADTLRRDGLDVETAGSGRAALARVARGGIDLVVSDLRMPDLDGPALIKALRAERPELAARMILLTGDALGAGTNETVREAALPVFEKPLDLAALRCEVRRLLGA